MNPLIQSSIQQLQKQNKLLSQQQQEQLKQQNISLSLITNILKSVQNAHVQYCTLDLLAKLLLLQQEQNTPQDELYSQQQLLVGALEDIAAQQMAQENYLQLFKVLQNGINSGGWRQAVLLRALRIIYNQYLTLPQDSQLSAVAQSTISQLIQIVYGRCVASQQKEVRKSDNQEPVAQKSQSQNTAERVPDAKKLEVKISQNGVTVKESEAAPSEKPAQYNIPIQIVQEIVDQVVQDKHSDEKVVQEQLSPKEVNSAEKPPQLPAKVPVQQRAQPSVATLNLADALLIFKALCRLSNKLDEAPDQKLSSKEKDAQQRLALRNKILALELLGVIVREHFQVVRLTTPIYDDEEGNDTTFVAIVKSLLVPSLTKNASSLVPEILERSLDIFVALVLGLRQDLKQEIEVFMSDVVFSLLETLATAQVKSSTFAITQHQKLSLLRHLTTMLQDPRLVVELYLNYDCDGTALENVYERIVLLLSRVLGRNDWKLVQPGQANGSSSSSTSSNVTQLVGAGGADVGAFGVWNDLRTRYKNATTNGSGSSGASPVKQQSVVIASARSIIQPAMAGTADNSTGSIVTSLGPLGIEREGSLKFRALECLATLLKSLVLWSQGYDQQPLNAESPTAAAAAEDDSSAPVSVDLSKFESAKHQKAAIKDGVQLFNWKYKRGIEHWKQHGIIDDTPQSIAKLLLDTPNLNKKMIGEYLGEGNDFCIAVMHSFVDEMNFDDLGFVDALRQFLQHFRLPGEAQKIDRFMLKFAERFHMHNPGVFTNADTAYILAYSVIMLNTDQHNPQIKKRMTKEEFLRNNRKISDGKDLDPTFLSGIYDEIVKNEIRMKDEEPAQLRRGGSGDFDQMSQKQRKEAFLVVSEEISQRFKQNRGSQRSGTISPFHVAHYAEHVKSMMELIWIPVLAGISAALQESDISDLICSQLALMAFKSSVVLCCSYSSELALARNAFVSTLSKYAHVSNSMEFLTKNKSVLSISCLLDCGYLCGDGLGEAWLDVFRCVSQLERVVGKGNNDVASVGIIPGVGGVGATTSSDNASDKRPKSMKSDISEVSQQRTLSIQENILVESTSQSLLVQMDRIFTASSRLNGTAIVEFVRHLCTVSMEEIQQSTSSSPLSTVPRMYSLTKLVEISYYNMSRIRLEWSNIWQLLGEHFNVVGCHSNQHVAFFSVDSLRQLSMKFLEKEELANFKFQKDFLRPFEHILLTNGTVVIKDMVLRCVHQLIQAKAQNIKSGWKAILATLSRAAKDDNESIVVMAFDTIKIIHNGKYMDSLVSNNTFADYVGALVEFARSRCNAKVSLQSVELLNSSIPKVLLVIDQIKKGKKALETSEGGHFPPMPVSKSATAKDDPVHRLWFPIHFGFYEMIMTCELEVRTRALKYLFETLKSHSSDYTPEFWDVISRGVLFPIFDDLKLTRSEKRKFENKEDMTVWLNTTLIQALRQLVDLVSFSFASLESMMLDGVLDLIKVCFGIPQENETLAKIGSSCLQQLVESNVKNMTTSHWEKIIDTIVSLFESTTAHMLFDDDFVKDVQAKAEEADKRPRHSRNTSVASQSTQNTPVAENSNMNLSNVHEDSAEPSPNEEKPKRQIKKDFQQIIIKSVLQLLVIQTSSDILESNQPVPLYQFMRSSHLMRLLQCLEKSYVFASKFNADMQFRVCLFKIGFMSQLPNLLKQETTAVNCLLINLFKVFNDVYGSSNLTVTSDIVPQFNLKQERQEIIEQVELLLVRTSLYVIRHFNTLEPQVKQRNIATWTPVVVKILNGYQAMDSEKFKQHIPALYTDILAIMSKHDLGVELRVPIYNILTRVDGVFGISEANKQ